MTTLIVVAHPDDETLGAGATISRLADEGESVVVAILGRSRVPDADTKHALKHLGVTDDPMRQRVYRLGLTDQQFDTIPLLRICQLLETLIARVRPDTVYTHHPGDLNLDHLITSRAVLTACRPVNKCPVRTIYAMEIPSSTEWGDQTFRPTTYIDVTDTLDRKLAAMEMYETERREWPHPRSIPALRALAMTRGSAAGLEFAEAFQLLRHIRD
jgi:LmbE family N-acetylglucosaminyl deacetylase